GGLQCAKALRGEPVDVVLVDQQNYHLFTPLLYQVASCLLAPSEITAPLRKVLRGAPNVRYRQGEAVDVDFTQRHVRLAGGAVLGPHEFRIVLLEGGDRVLPMFKRRLSAYGRRELERRGVDVRTDVLVASADDLGVVTRDDTELRTATLIWTAGVQPSAVPMH